MIHIALRSEYSFGQAYAPLDRIVALSDEAVGIADEGSTFGHVGLYNRCKDKGINPILGVRLQVVNHKTPGEKQWGSVYIFIATNIDGLREIYQLVKKAYDNFYYHAFITADDVNDLSKNVIKISERPIGRAEVDYLALSPFTNPVMIERHSKLKKVAMSANRYINPEDKYVYQLFAGDDASNSRKPQYVLPDDHHLSIFNDQSAIDNTFEIASRCNVEFKRSSMVRYKGKTDIRSMCEFKAKHKGVDLAREPYKARFEREIELIQSRDFGDYFLIVSDMVKHAKNRMLVGPSRGSSAGSLVCYLLDITEVDPIKYDLLFERFIDINRADLPDIDIDFPDLKREKVIKRLKEIYGDNHVRHIATVAKLKPKSAISIFAKNLCIPISASEDVKDAIIERSGGDARAAMCIKDTLETTEVGKQFIEHYPKMKLVEHIENHAQHTGKHAAGILVCNDDLTYFGGINSRSDTIMIDKDEAEGLNLLKIDVLGLRTLSVLEEVADRIGMPYSKYYTLDVEDAKVFKTFNDMRLFGIFQFEGYALQSVTRQMGVHKFDDIAAITALARPGPIHSGGTNLFVKRKIGEEPVSYLSEHPSVIEATKDTLGIIIYQEQLMKIAREYGNLSWEDVSSIRKAASKSLGEEFFNKYKQAFIEGASQHGAPLDEIEHVWGNMMTFGSWGFNKSHAVSYGLVSFWTAWAKTYYPMEFAAANMNHSRSEDSAIRILRDMVKHEGIEYVAIDPDESIDRWEISSDKTKLIGSLTNIKGVGYKKAKDIMARRDTGRLTKNQVMMLMDPDTPFDILFPAEHYWGQLYSKPWEYGLDRKVEFIEDIRGEGQYLFIGKLVDRNLRDLNEYQSVVKRGGEIIENDTLFLNLTLEDDTDSIICTIDRFKFEEMGRKIAERGKVGHDWYLVKGYIKGQWRRMNVTQILNLWEWSQE